MVRLPAGVEQEEMNGSRVRHPAIAGDLLNFEF